jgi:hypothetical protein
MPEPAAHRSCAAEGCHLARRDGFKYCRFYVVTTRLAMERSGYLTRVPAAAHSDGRELEIDDRSVLVEPPQA